jgi:carboxyl-terminal processing protease
MILPRGGLLIGLLIGGVLSSIFGLGFWAGDVFDRHQVSSEVDLSNSDVRNFLEAYKLVTQQSYYHPNKHQLIYAAIDGMLSATGDPHTIFLSPPQNKSANQALEGSRFSGIGAIVVPYNGLLKVLAPMPNEPAAQAGIQEGDVITAIDGKSVLGMSGDSAIARIHGRAGSKVRLDILRSGTRRIVLEVKREQIAPITAYERNLGHRVGYIQILSFGSDTGSQVANAIQGLNRQRVRGLIVDLRGNPGGYVDAAQQVVSHFLAHGVVAYERDPDKHLTTLAVLPGQRLTRLPIAVLVDSQTASAAEITAAALQDEDGAKLFGTRTYGKGSMQSVYTLGDGSTVRITDRLWLTPRKQSVSNIGLRPDFFVLPGGSSASDHQLTAAERYLIAHAAA